MKGQGMGGARALMRKLTNKKVKAEKIQKLKEERGRRQHNPPATYEDIPERNIIDKLFAQAETAHEFDPTRTISLKKADKPGYVGKHWYYPSLFRMSVLLPAYAELLSIKDTYDDQELWEAQRVDIWTAILEVWRDVWYHRAVTTYYKHKHILGPATYDAWMYAQKEAEAEKAAQAKPAPKKKPARRRKK